MRKLFFLCIVFILCQTLLIAQGTLETRSFYSQNLGVSKTFKIYLPPDYYQTSDYYPVVYFLRNYEDEWFNVGYNGRTGTALKEIIDQLIASGLIGKMIIVTPNTGSDNGDYSCCTVNILQTRFANSPGIGTGKFEDYFLLDLIPHIDSVFRTIPDQHYRGIDGFSLGGYSSTCLSLRNPQVFSSVGSFDGTIMWKNLDDLTIQGNGYDDPLWCVEDPNYPLKQIFDWPRNIPYMFRHSAIEIIDSADVIKLDLIKKIRFHISESYCEGTGNHLRNLQLIENLSNKGIRNSWGNPLISLDAAHDYGFADEHATASLIKHWQTFSGTKISAPTLINFSITEVDGKDYEVALFNYGPGSLTINSIQTGSPNFILDNLPSFPLVLNPESESISFSISFIPPLPDFYTDTCFIFSNDPITPVAKIILRGKGGSFKAEHENIYAVSSANKLYKIIKDSLTVEDIGLFGRGWTSITQLNVNPFSSELIGLSKRYSPNLEFVRINSKAGDVFKINGIELSEQINGMAYYDDSFLYLATSNGKIYRSDPYYPFYPNPLIQIASTSLPITSFAYNSVTREFWAGVGSFNNKDRIYKINIFTGDTIFIGNTELNDYTYSLTFDDLGNLYGLVGSSNNLLISINTTTGLGDTLVSLGNLGIKSIAILRSPPSYIEEEYQKILPDEYVLYQSYPNPFNPSTTIKYSLPNNDIVSLKVFDIIGREVAMLVNEYKTSGTYSIEFNASQFASGIYFYKLQAGSFVQTRKMILLK